MKSGAEAIALIQDVFPDSRKLVEQLWNENSDFRELCEAYAECEAACQYWHAVAGKSSKKAREYSELRKNLHEDIVKFLAREGSS